jgi:hypothetical protein
MSNIEICCPNCKWEPRSTDHWMCEPSCGWAWNTFDTGGVCPQCGKSWEETQCLSCHQWSRHVDWYHELAPEMVARELALAE